MGYMTLPERIGFEKGLEQGRCEGANKFLSIWLEEMFKVIPELYLKKLQAADIDTLLRWAERLVDARTIEEVFSE